MTVQVNSRTQLPVDQRKLLLEMLHDARDESFSSLSTEQRRLWLLRQLDPSGPTHVSRAVEIRGRLHVPTLAQSADDLLSRHAILRSTFLDLGRRPARIVAASARLNLRVEDLSGLSEPEYDQKLRELAERDFEKLFELRSPPLVRLTLVRRGDDRHALLFTIHQLVSDGASASALIRELFQLYEGRLAGVPSSPASLVDSFASLAREEHEWLNSAEYEEALQYWREALDDVQSLHIPTDFARPSIKTHRGAAERRELNNPTVLALTQVCEREGVSLELLFLAAFNALLFWYSGQDDLTVGIEDVRPRGAGVGPLTNTLVIRTRLSGNPSFMQLLRQVRSRVEEAKRRGRMPFAQLIESLEPERDVSRTPMFQAGFVAEEIPTQDLRFETVELMPLDLTVVDGMLDLNLRASVDGGVRLSLEYNTDLFRAGSVGSMLDRLVMMLDAIAADQSLPLSRLFILPETERHLLALEWNRTEREFPSDKCLHQLVEDQVKRTPDAVAVICGAEHLTYGELDQRAEHLAARLRRRGVGPESRIGICHDRSLETVTALLAVLKAGAAYVPLDTDLPPARINFILQDAGAEIVLTRRAFSDNLTNSNLGVIVIDDEPDTDDGVGANVGDLSRPQVRPDSLAYIIYTSGSTGSPKGVGVSHRSVVNNLTWRQSRWTLSADDRVLQSISFSFDPSLWTTFWPLLAGACVVLPGFGKHFDSVALARILEEEQITVVGGAPSLFAVLADEKETLSRTAVRYVFSGGESLGSELQRKLQEVFNAEIYNVYGPTEATIDSTYWLCSPDSEGGAAPIGIPGANTKIYLLNRYLEINPAGVLGEIFIGGQGLARGYTGHPGLTAEKFLPDPFCGVPGTRMYSTGDLGKQRPDGVLEFNGRIDEQVKIRGFRIELSEIERTLMQHGDVAETAVIVTRGPSGEPRITAYVGPLQGRQAPSRDGLIAFLSERLPAYMIPDIFIVLDALPHTVTGKVDRRNLPPPDDVRAGTALAFIQPRTPLEAEISQIVGPVLGLDHVSVEADLFALGCNSLLMARIASRLSSTYQLNMSVIQIFRDPTIAGLARLIDNHQRTGKQESVQSWSEEQLAAEATLDPSITAEGLPVADYCSPSNIFLTGVTGYLAPFLVEKLLSVTDADVHCLVRAADAADGLQRIQQIMEKYRIWREEFRERIHPVVGDLSKPRLGLSEQEFTELAGIADVIYHCGALVNFVYPYSALKAPNVRGTHEILRLACQKKLKAVHYTSTIDVLLATHAGRPLLETDEFIRHPREIPDAGYPLSKLVAERMMVTARSRGIPVCVYRPSVVMGHAESGATQTNLYLMVGLKGYIDLGVLPEPRFMMDFVSVDFAASAMAHISRQRESIGKYFHIWNQNPVHVKNAYEWIRSFGYDVQAVDWLELRDRVLGVDQSNALYPFLAGFRQSGATPAPSPTHDPAAMEGIDLSGECMNTFRAIEGTGIECPLLTERMTHLCLSYLNNLGFLPDPSRQRN